jgi:hypothetical protein
MRIPAVLFALLPAAVPPQDPGDPVGALLGDLRTGRAAAAAAALEGKDLRDRLAADPGALETAAWDAMRNSAALAWSSPKDARKIADALAASVASAPAEEDGTGPRARARAFARLFLARTRKAAGEAVGADEFVRCADALESLAAASQAKGACLLEAGRALADAADLPGADGSPLWLRAEQFATRVRAEHGDRVPWIAEGARLLLDRVRWGASRREGRLGERLAAVLEYVASARKAEPDHPDLLAVHNSVAALARGLRLRKPEVEFEADPAEVCAGLATKVPRGSEWTGGNGGDIVQRRTPMGRIRTLRGDGFDWDGTYDIGGASVNGDSLKAVAGATMDQCRRGLAKVRTSRPVAPGRVGKCESGWAWELEGVDAEGNYRRIRSWTFKSGTGRRRTYRIVLEEGIEEREPDPQIEFVLAGIAETGGK